MERRKAHRGKRIFAEDVWGILAAVVQIMADVASPLRKRRGEGEESIVAIAMPKSLAPR